MFLTLCLNDSKVEITRRFYERLGYDFAPEQHGEKGLPHYATVVSSMPVEIYPAPKKPLPPEDRLWIGVTVNHPENIKAELIKEFGGDDEPRVPTTKTGIATLRDPSGILVRLFPKP